MATVTLQNGVSPTAGYSGGKDAHIIQFQTANNTGANATLYICSGTGGAPSSDKKNLCLAMDISGLGFTGTETVNSSTVNLRYTGNDNGKNTKTVAVAALRRDWTEGSKTGKDGQAASSGEVTYNSAKHSVQTWTTAGAFDTTNDKYADESSTVLSSQTTGNFISWSITQMMQDWISGAKANYGMVFTCTAGDNNNGTWNFDSCQASTAANRPYITIDYTTAAGQTYQVSFLLEFVNL